MPVARFGISAMGQQGIEPGALFAVELAIDCGEVPELGVDRSHPMFGGRSNQFVLTKLRAQRSREGTGRVAGMREAVCGRRVRQKPKRRKLVRKTGFLAGERLSAPPCVRPPQRAAGAKNTAACAVTLLYAVLVRQFENFLSCTGSSAA